MNATTILKKQFPKAEFLRVGVMGDFDLNMNDGTDPSTWMIKDGKVIPVDFPYLIDKSFGAGSYEMIKGLNKM